MLTRLNKIRPWQAALIIVLIGFAVFFTGLTNQFQGDDSLQIISNIPVHSITNIKLFFEGGTFYNGQGLAPLAGIYYRPLMMTVFSLIYTIFGAKVVVFHLVQLLLWIACAFVLYLFLRYSFKPILALLLALIFLVHPLNSQAVFSIPYTQDVLSMLFGLLALWLLIRFKSVRSLLLVALCLVLSLFSKESAVVFVILAFIYLIWFNRQRLYQFIGIMALPLAGYVWLRINAVGLFQHSVTAPIDKFNLAGRLFTMPSIVLMFLEKFIFPWKLVSSYYWAYPNFSVRHVLFPLLIDLAVLAAIIYFGFLVHRKLSKATYYTYLFFSIWALLALLPYLQLVPLDMTASEAWFCLTMVGWLGIVGIILGLYRISLKWVLVVGVILVTAFGIRTAYRGLDWKSSYTIAAKDYSVSHDNYVADKNIALYYFSQGDYTKSRDYAQQSVSLFPNVLGYNTLGMALSALNDYPASAQAFTAGMKYQDYVSLYENRAALTATYGTPAANIQFLVEAVNNFPKDSQIWFYLAIQEYRDSNISNAKLAITQAYKYAPSNQTVEIIDSRIMNNQPLNISFSTK